MPGVCSVLSSARAGHLSILVTPVSSCPAASLHPSLFPSVGKPLFKFHFVFPIVFLDDTNVSLGPLLFRSPAVFAVHNLSIFNLLHSDLFS